jgi:hypothetical protein
MSELENASPDKHTMERLEAVKKIAPSGVEYWMARAIQPILGYEEWRNLKG